MKITKEQRQELLKGHNDLKDMLTCLHECGDLWVSDLAKLESHIHCLHKILGFVPKQDDEGRDLTYSDYILAEDR